MKTLMLNMYLTCIWQIPANAPFVSPSLNCTIYLLHSTPTLAGRTERRYGSLFVKPFNYLVGYTSPDAILYLTEPQHLLTDQFGHVKH
jgi:hypothetical protein